MELTVVVCCQVLLYAEGLSRILSEDTGLKLLGTAENDNDIKKLIELDPDIIITDVAKCKTVLGFLPKDPEKKALLINDAGGLNTGIVMNMISDGLGGILPKDTDEKQLLKAIRKLHDGELWIDRHTLHDVLMNRKDSANHVQLTKKELEVLNYICKGMSNKEIAGTLFVSEQTIKTHCNHLFKKFGVSSRLKLALKAPAVLPQYSPRTSQLQ